MGGLSTLAQQALLGGKREASPALSLASSVGGSGSGIGGAGIGSNGISSRSGTGVGGSDVLFRQHMEGGQSQSQSQTRFSGSPLLGGGDEVFSGGSIYSTTMNTIRVGQVRGQGMQEGRGYHQHPTLGFSTYAMPQPLLYPTGPEDLSPFEFKNPRSWFGEEGGVGTGMVEAEVMQPGSRLDLGFGRYGGVGREEEDSEEEGKDGGEEVQGARELEVSTSGTTEAPMSSDAPSQEPSNTAGPTDSSNPPSTTSQNQSQPRTAQVSSPPQHQHQHPAHPGPISLPPPPPVTAFPIPPPHSLSPHHYMPMSPYMSPLYHPAIAMGMGEMGMTPHGLPPITPSMPSFTFLPPPPLSPGLSSPYGEEVPYLPSMRRRGSSGHGIGGGGGVGVMREDLGNEASNRRSEGSVASASPPIHSHPHQYPPSHSQQQLQQQLQQQQQQVQQQQSVSPTTGQAAYHHHHAHHPPPPMMSPYTPFSPGVTMSPGAFWGWPGWGGNPHINPAVGAPVHSQPLPIGAGAGAVAIGGSDGSTQQGQQQQQQQRVPQPGEFYAVPVQGGHEEEYGYFSHLSPVGHVQFQHLQQQQLQEQQVQVQQQEEQMRRQQEEQYRQFQEEMREEVEVTEVEGYFPFVPPRAVVDGMGYVGGEGDSEEVRDGGGEDGYENENESGKEREGEEVLLPVSGETSRTNSGSEGQTRTLSTDTTTDTTTTTSSSLPSCSSSTVRLNLDSRVEALTKDMGKTGLGNGESGVGLQRTKSAQAGGGVGDGEGSVKVLPRADSDPSYESSEKHKGTKRNPGLEIDVAKSKTEGWVGRAV